MSATTPLSSTSVLLRCLSRPGPSRLAQRRTPCISCLREASTSSAGADFSTSDDGGHSAAAGPSSSSSSASASASAPSSRQSIDGYATWLRAVGEKFREPPINGPNWLGGEVPYATNPTFRPPPPISDAVKERIYNIYFNVTTKKSDLTDGSSSSPPSIAQIAQAFNISKKRVEAILRLKILEKEWEHEKKRADNNCLCILVLTLTFLARPYDPSTIVHLVRDFNPAAPTINQPLQVPFQESMEKYLGCRHIRPTASSGMTDLQFSRQESDLRSLHPSARAEQEEEAAHAALSSSSSSNGRDMDNTAFTARDTLIEDLKFERMAFEFRSEEDGSYASTRPGGPDALDVPHNRVYSAEEQAKHKAQWEARRQARAEKVKSLAHEEDVASRLPPGSPVNTRTVRNGRSTYRFNNIAEVSDKSAVWSNVGLGTRQDDTGRREKKVARAERVKKALERQEKTEKAKKK